MELWQGKKTMKVTKFSLSVQFLTRPMTKLVEVELSIIIIIITR